jgi:hypothetical protein
MKIIQFEELFAKGLAGDIPLSELCSILSTDRTLSADERGIVHSLIHFATDRDVRNKDREYDQYLRAQLDTLLAELKRKATGTA